MPIDITGLFQPSGGAGAFKLTLADDIDVIGATDGTGDGTMATADLLICETNPAATAVKKILISQLPFLSGITANAAEVNVLDGVTAGAITASKAVVVDASRDIATLHDVTIDGTLSDGTLSIVGGEILDATTLEATTTLGIEIGDAQQLVLTDGKLNPTTDSDIDLGDSTHYFKNAYIDAITTTGNLTIGGNIGCGAITSTGLLGVTVAGNTAVLQNTTDAVSNQVAQFKAGNRATAANDDEGYFNFFCDDDGGTQSEIARLKWIIKDITAGGETGALDIQLSNSGALSSFLLLDSENSEAVLAQKLKAPAFYAKDTTSGFYLKIQADAGEYSANRLLEIDLNNADRVVKIAGNASIDQDLRILASPTFAGLTLTGSLIIADANYIGSATDTDAIQIEADGDVVLTQNLYITNNPTPTIFLGSSSLAKIWCSANTDLIIRNYNRVAGVLGYNVDIGAYNKDNAFRNIVLTSDDPSFAPGTTDGVIDLGKAARQWKDFYIAGDAAIGGGVIINTDTLVVDSTNNRVGIGIATPLQLLHLGSFSPIVRFEDENATTQTEASGLFEFGKGSGGWTRAAWFGLGSSSNATFTIVNETSGGNVNLSAGAGGDVLFDAGGSFLFRDQDAADAVRMSIDSATGLMKTYDIQPYTDNTHYLGKNDDDTPLAWKGVILKDTTDGKYYRIEVINGTVTATDLTD